MITLTAADVAKATSGRLTCDPATAVTGAVVADSRQVEPGSLFVAIPGAKVDGADFAAGAVAAGATLVLVARELPGLPVVVVDDVVAALGNLARTVLDGLRAANPNIVVFSTTGSAGKTTTKDLLAHLVAEGEDTIAPKGSYNSDVGLPLTLLRATPATTKFVMEIGADKPGDIGYLARIARPHIAILLMAGSAHIEFFGSQDAIANAKAEVFEGLVPGGTAVLNADDFRILALADRLPARGQRYVTFGRGDDAQVRATDIELDSFGRARFTMHLPAWLVDGEQVSRPDGAPDEFTFPVQLQLVGEHHVYNALAAATAAVLAGVEPAIAAERLGTAKALSPHRMAVTTRPDGLTIIDDAYNAAPESMVAALTTLARMAGTGDCEPDGRTVAVVGEMRELGDRALIAHQEIGRLIVSLGIDLTVVVGQGAKGIYDGATGAGDVSEADGADDVPQNAEVEIRFAPDLDAARNILRECLRPGDRVLVKASNSTGLWQLADELTGGALP